MAAIDTAPLTQPPIAEAPPVIEPSRPAPAPPPPEPGEVRAVVEPQFRSYVVRAGDTSFEAIARRNGGGSALAEAISRANPYVTPNRLVPGRTVLRIPLDPSNVQGKVVTLRQGERPAGAGKPQADEQGGAGEREYTVQSSDTLSGIAQKMYGRSAQWRKIYQANRDRIENPDRLKAGVVLRIPPAD
jgi:nucleoid-associated protein YgaU